MMMKSSHRKRKRNHPKTLENRRIPPFFDAGVVSIQYLQEADMITTRADSVVEMLKPCDLFLLINLMVVIVAQL